MNLDDITLVLGIDKEHLQELRWSWPTWMRFKPELLQMSAIVFYDPSQVVPEKEAFFLHEHPRLRFVPWHWNLHNDQREKMITAWMHIPAREVKTPWYLKLDTDAIATGAGEWIRDEWFHPEPGGESPVFIASPSQSSKPPYIINSLDEWADQIPGLAAFPRWKLPPSGNEIPAKPPTIISWLFFGRTSWCCRLSTLLAPDGKMPLACDDTFHFFCAKRMNQPYLRVEMDGFHWEHKRNWSIQRTVRNLGIKPAKYIRADRAGSIQNEY